MELYKYSLILMWLPAVTICTSLYCSDPWCDPHHQPYPNIFATMVGYNILKGNPFTLSKQNDPGFSTSYLFQAMVPETGGGYRLHGGVTVRKVVKCDLSLLTSAVSTVKQYQETMAAYSSKGTAFASNLEADVSATVKGVGIKTKVPPLVQASFAASKEYKDNLKFFSNTRGVVTVNDATCTSYTMHLSTYNPPPFTTAFEKSLEELNAATTQSDQVKDRAFRKFTYNFGTHFLAGVAMGARLAITRRYRRDEYQRATDTDLQQCNSWRLKISLGASVSRNQTKCNNFQSDTLDRIDNIYSREYISSYGSKPAKDLIVWSQQKFEAPLPIKMSLSPILNLFQSSYMGKYSSKIDFVGILKWLAPRYYDYCNKYQKALDVASCDNVDKGCGFNDNCKAKTQQCIPKPTTPNGYQCCNSACTNSPCKNEAKCINLDSCGFKCECQHGFEGNTCEKRLMVKERLKSEVLDYLRSHTRSSNDEIRNQLLDVLQRRYDDNYLISLMSYQPVSGNRHHDVRGNYVSLYRQYGRNVIVGWTNRNANVLTKVQMDDFKVKLTNILTNRGCHPPNAVNEAFKLASDLGYHVQMAAAVRFGNGLRFSSYSRATMFLNYVCATTKSWGKTYRHQTSLVVVFGSD